ncbi:MAG TPA: ABC transporter ATP-binding protein [bacterium]|jgi:heme exporter protein A|nr:ABC transporter ATP-binding protein [bacterium]HOZ22471.1 ABC transporter ATP-binding protein [bacterium]
MIVCRDIRKTFGPMQALAGVSFSIGEGELAALLGANGAGKSTLLHLLAGLTRASSGSAEVAGFNVRRQPHEVRRRIGVVSHQTYLYEELSAEENLRFYGRMYGVTGLQERIDDLLAMMELWPRRDDLVRTFSRGMQQRLALARAMLHRPPLLLLDEPFTGLDLHATDLLTRFIEGAAAGKMTVLMTVHDPDYALAHSRRLLVLQKGRLVLDQPAERVRKEDLLPYYKEK